MRAGMQDHASFATSYQLFSSLKMKNSIIVFFQVCAGYTTMVQALDVVWLQFQTILCMLQGFTEVLQGDIHMCKIAHDANIFGGSLEHCSNNL